MDNPDKTRLVEDQMELVPCNLCGASTHEKLLEASDAKYGGVGVFTVVRCRGCRLVFTNPRPTKEIIGRYYSTGYRPYELDPREHESRPGALLRRLAFGQRPLQPLGWVYNSLVYRAFLPPETEPGLVLDVGCGTGAYLKEWQHLGWRVVGLEPHEQSAAHARQILGAEVHNGSVEEVALPAATFDVITMCHSLEHIYSPKGVLTQLGHALRPGGRLLLMVPNFASWLRLLFGARWMSLEVPRHLYHFEAPTLARLLRSAGFRVLRVAGTGFSGVLYHHVQRAMGHQLGPTPATLGGLLTLCQLPLAVARRTDALWAVATTDC